MLLFPELFVPNRTVMGANLIGPVSLQPLKFLICRFVITVSFELVRIYLPCFANACHTAIPHGQTEYPVIFMGKCRLAGIVWQVEAQREAGNSTMKDSSALLKLMMSS
jgi:hypothetical protein